MQNPFLIARLVFFLILAYLNIVALAITVWLLHSLAERGVTEIGPSLFVVVNSSGLLAMEFVAVADYWIPLSRAGQVKFECGWTFILSMLQIGAALDVLFHGPPVYCSAEGWMKVCTVYTLLTALTWSSSIILFTYFLALACTACTHRFDYPTVWIVTVRQVPWFTDRKLCTSFEPQPMLPKIVVTKEPYENPVFHAHDEEQGRGAAEVQSNSPVSAYSEGASSNSSRLALRIPPSPVNARSSFRPSWAKKIMTRRGIDPPFVPAPTLPPPPWERPYINADMMLTSAPPLPPKAHLPAPSGLNGGYLGIPAPKQRISYPHFPMDVSDHDRPIENSSPISQWVRADEYGRI